ncbi:hypothetical protein [Candidatus Rhabdochlamydia sp. T3358]|uniref:hypothetical protein n=1 Tax=Candidatus Rhabdochlamydia sp. T3358 TaxID=2099795 RepID=UPI0010B5EEB5|nr:hypothetical protein [Candidatus Rhabdochlamydia sp. T3358]VHO04425.1 hypothetical protein RHT_01387 [Candidatus Rhabdochlamydia sp. T3358]
MSNKKFDEKTSREIVVHFLNRLKTECKNQLSLTSQERLHYLINLLSNDPNGAETWKTTYQMTFDKSFEPQVLISEEEVFTTLIGFCARQTHSWKFNLTGLMDLLFLIRYRPQEHEKERTIWKEVVIDASRETLL